MGCGASVFAISRTGKHGETRRLIAAAPAGAADRDIVTPPSNRGRPHLISLPGAASTPNAKKAGLRIDTGVASREKAGMSVTPVGKAADEYKYYCPLCMMFFRSILEFPCCRQSTCAFCFGEYLERQMKARKPAASADEIAAAVAAVPIAAAAGKAGRAAAERLLLPAGCPCPQCSVTCKVARSLHVVEGYQEAHVKYLDSPQTRAKLDRISKTADSDDLITLSPLKVGDDFNVMARKMLPFGKMDAEEDAAFADAPPVDTGTDAAAAPAEDSRSAVAEADGTSPEADASGLGAAAVPAEAGTSSDAAAPAETSAAAEEAEGPADAAREPATAEASGAAPDGTGEAADASNDRAAEAADAPTVAAAELAEEPEEASAAPPADANES